MKRGTTATKKRWYKFSKAVAQFAGCYDQATRNIRSGSNANDIKKLAYIIYSDNYAYSSSSNRETPLAEDAGIDSPVRTQGSKKSKRRGKGKAQMYEDLSEAKSSVIKQLYLIEEFKIVREKELLDEREHREKLIAIKEKELQIQQEMKEQELPRFRKLDRSQNR
ncbi:hypothetical protein PIB30_036559 [Stylosanthes scabra]|uniref:No apical meristem-associated C-terminal domain-containing protein n=1 Tax=Stylosanthes scabra TaxID=79078 RepID=A0ABU6WGD6_9FABA|nr:hypothetical protein [Stylosanthes scabra]